MSETAIIIYGATGDLAKKYLYSAINDLIESDAVANFDLIAIGNRNRTLNEYLDILNDTVLQPSEINDIKYISGNHLGIAKTLNNSFKLSNYSNVLIIISVAPKYYQSILKSFITSGLMNALEQTENYRILIEKPFGKNLESAKDLVELTDKIQNVLLIDHYLGKPALLSTLSGDIKKLPQPQYIDRLEVTFYEILDVDNRIEYYDQTGAWLDVGQNHMLQILSTILQFICKNIDADLTKLDIIKSLSIKVDEEIWSGQYRGYPSSDLSTTETAFKISLRSDINFLSHINITLKAGKALDKRETSIYVLGKENLNDWYLQITPTNDPKSDKYFDNAYSNILQSALSNNDDLFVTPTEAIAQWELAKEVTSALLTRPLSIYSKGVSI